jgi:hypothetical protein
MRPSVSITCRLRERRGARDRVERLDKSRGDAESNLSPYPQHQPPTLASLTKPLFVCVLAAVALLLFWNQRLYYLSPETEMQPAIADWRDRAERVRNPESWQPERKGLVFAVIRNAQVEHHALTLALFRPNIGVDASGTVLALKEDDFSTLSSLASQTLDLPQTDNFRNTWIIRRPTTSQPIERLFVPTSDSEVAETSVQGYNDKGEFELKRPVGEITVLPPLLQDLFGLILKARADYDRQHRNEAVLNKVLDVVGNE